MEESEILAAIETAFRPAVEMQAIAAKGVLTQDEVRKFYGLSVSRLEKLRAANRGPHYIQLAENGRVLYTHDDIKRWLNMQAISTRAV